MSSKNPQKVKINRVIDGDTVAVTTGPGLFRKPREKRIRLWGIDAPETSQKGGEQSTKHLQRLIGMQKNIWMTENSIDQYGRTVAVIQPRKNSPTEKTYNHRMVQDGQAHTYMLSGPESESYRQAEQKARASKKGIWKTQKNVHPAQYRNTRQRIQQKRTRRINILLATGALLIAAYIAYLFLQ